MSMMTAKVRTAFFSILRSSLWQNAPADPISLTADEWRMLYDEAARHTLLGVMYDALPSGGGITPQVALEWLLAVRGIEQSYSLQKAVYEAQAGAWEKRNIKALLLKGLTVARMYPKPEHRSCGDLDWYFFSEEDFDAATETARANGADPVRDSDGDVHYLLSGLEIEHHHRWNDASSSRARAVLDVMDPLSPVSQLAMLSVHILKHALVGGIGLRQLCDLAKAYQWYEGGYDRRDLLALYDSAGLSEWNTLLEGVLSKWLEVPGLKMQRGYENDVDMFTEMVLADGDFSSYNGRNGISRLAILACRVSRRCRFFRRYAPAEFAERLSSLVKGRVRRLCRVENGGSL